MTNEKNESSDESSSFKKIRDYLEGRGENRKVTIGLLATAIEDKNTGIYTWDRFGRLVKADADAEGEILNFLADFYQSEYDFGEFFDDILSPFEGTRDHSVNPSIYFGWPSDKIPDFEKLAKQNIAPDLPDPRHQEKAAIKRRQDTLLVIIGALCVKAGIKYRERGAAKEIEKIMENNRSRRTEDTILKVLKKVQEVYEE
jgi:hypothetical protein